MSHRVFFATDIHGSDKCWMKFINAAEFYKVNRLILGGDLTSKGFVAIIRQPDGTYKTNFRGKVYYLKDEKELEETEKRIRWAGLYTYRTTPQELPELESEERTRNLMLQLAKESIERWIKIAEEKLRRIGVKIFVTGGNDDEFAIDEMLQRSDVLEYVEGRVVKLDQEHEMISTGYGNPTPWRCPRDISEEELGSRIDEMASKVENMKSCIFNIHVPPFDSRLDDAPELDETLRIKYGGAKVVPVGSVAVRRAIEKYQPLLSLHGHIHESKGSCKIGETLCINPGSMYGDGILQGVLMEIDSKQVKSFAPMAG